MPYPLTTVMACNVVGMQRQRFNEIAAAGLYVAAPMTTPGKARRFEEPDMIALYIFAQLTGLGVRIDQAGFWVQSVIDGLAKYPDEETVTIAILANSGGLVSIAIGERQITKTHSAGKPIIFSLTFRLPYIRSDLRDRIEAIESVRIVVGGEIVTP